MGLFNRAREDAPLAPTKDSLFSYLYRRVIEGFVPLYQAEVPIRLIRPFDPKFRPQNSEAGRKMLNGMIRQHKAGQFHLAGWVYPEKDGFVLSDDYLSYYAALEVGNESLTCNVMGEQNLVPTSEPAPLEYVRKLPGGPDFDPSNAKVRVIKEAEGD